MSSQTPPTGIGQRVAQGVAWTVAFRMVDRFIGICSTLVLVRLLTPEDFGIVAMAMMLLALLEVLTVADFGNAIIQNQSATRDHYDSAWTLNVLLGLTAGCLMWILAHPIATFFNDQRLVPVIWVLGAVPVIDGLYNMGCVDFRKYLQFRRDFLFMAGRKLIGVIAVIPLAFIFRSYWALVGGIIAGRTGGIVLSYLLHPFRPHFSLRSAGSLFRFSRWIMVNSGLTFLSSRGAHLIIGRLAGAQALGLYTVSHEMANLPTTELAAPINRAVFPGYATLSGDRKALRSGFLRVVGLIAVIAIPAGLGMAAVAHLFVPAVLGPNWSSTAPLISLLAIGGSVHVLQANIESLYYSLGRPKLKALFSLFEMLLLLPLTYLLMSRYQLLGVAYAFLISTFILVPANFSVALRLLQLNAGQLLAILWRPLLAGAVMAFAVLRAFPVSGTITGTLDNAVALAMAVGFGAVVYIIALVSLWTLSGRQEGAENWLYAQVRAIAYRRFGSRPR